jgi:pimeloyl-ACP methyl ester carboxylesterase
MWMFGSVAPRSAERFAAWRFFRPARGRHPQAPAVPGWVARQFQVRTSGSLLTAWSWGSGPTVMLVHGWNGSAAQLSGFVGPLLRRGFRVVAYDQPGHGHSLGRFASLPLFIESTRAVAAICGPVEAVVGHSLGGTGAALALAEEPFARRAVLLAAPAQIQYFAHAFTRMLGLPPQRAPGLLARIEQRVRRSADSFDLFRLAAGMQIPLLVMHDAKDREVPFEHGLGVAAAWPGAQFERLERLGHTRLLTDPAVIQRVVDFVSNAGMALRSA